MQKFIEAVQSELQKRGYTPHISEVLKNNDVILHELTIFEENSDVFPILYLESFYYDYQEGMTLDAICDCILNVSKSSFPSFDVSKISDWEAVKPMLRLKVVNAEKNQAFLADTPHVVPEGLDFALIFYVAFKNDASNAYSISVKKHHAKAWGC